MILEEIIRIKKEIVEKKKKRPLKERNFPVLKLTERLEKEFGIIAEVKKASPSAGILKKNYRPADIAKIYEECGASGISVLTCEPYFFGSIEHLRKVKENVNIPVLMKDFIFDEYQILEGKYSGADIILLIAKILQTNQLKKLSKFADSLNLEVIVEVHDKDDIKKAFKIENWENKIIGINNRDLESLKVDINTTFKLLKLLPKDQIPVISESGIKGRKEIMRLKEEGIKGVLVGETLLKSKDLRKKFKEIFGK
ncbi:MAG: indole-3-glycerol phosphate synthase TrpC [Candidatus Omnitrophota bacterium]|nr:MAG: indole-3-glycerol phosphate synthase TrpC [Candidatus Omnitrophota bacterium]